MPQNVIEVIARGRDFVSPVMSKMSESMKKLQKSVFSLKTAFVGLAAGFGGKAIKDLALFTANVDLLRVSMHQLARVNGINAKYLDANVEVMRSMGVATDDAMRTLNRFIRVNLDLTKATQFVRVAQDLAVISQRTTSDVVEQLTRGIITLRAQVLRNAGVFLTAQLAAEEWAKENDRTVKSMSTAEKQAAVFNKILRDAPKFMGAYEASLSTAGKKVLQLDRLWKEAKIALGSFTQDALMIGIESIQDYLKAIVKMRETGKLDEFGKSMSNTLVTIINGIKKLTEGIVWLGKTMYESRMTILALVIAFKSFEIIISVTKSIWAFNAALIASQGDGIIPFISSIQTLTVELGIMETMTISLATALTILGLAITHIGIGYLIGTLISTSDVMKDLRDLVMNSHLPEEIKKFFDEWIFGALKVQRLEKQNKKIYEENAQKRIALRLKEARKIQKALAEEEKQRRETEQKRMEFSNLIDQIAKLEESSLSKTEKKLKEISQLIIKLKVQKLEPVNLVNKDLLEENLNKLLEIQNKFQKKLVEEREKGRLDELEKTARHGDSLVAVLSAKLELWTEKVGTLQAQAGEAFASIGQIMQDSIGDAIFAMITGTNTLEEVWKAAWQSMLKSAIDSIINMMIRLIASYIIESKINAARAEAQFAVISARTYGEAFAASASLGPEGLAAAPAAGTAAVAANLAGMAESAAEGQALGLMFSNPKLGQTLAKSIPTLASGGVVDSATLAIVGEAGPEAIIPLNNPEAQRKLPGSSVNIGTIEMFPNVTEGDKLFNMPRTKLERWVRQELIPVFDSLDGRNIRPQRG